MASSTVARQEQKSNGAAMFPPPTDFKSRPINYVRGPGVESKELHKGKLAFFEV